jgi:predicted TIM-barrel fold metal-dependent hydrolase
MDPNRLTAIDVHTRVLASVMEKGRPAAGPDALAVPGTVPEPTVPELAAYYRERSMAAVVFTVDSITRTGREPRVSNEEIADQADLHTDVLIPFASVDPGRGAAAVRIARRLIRDHGVRGFAFHPSEQGFFPDDPAVRPLYDVIQEAGLPAVFHCGRSTAGAGRRGGGGVRLKYANPLCLDDVAVDFPDMTIVLAHPSAPWQDAALAVAGHQPLVHVDLSGWSPEHFPPQLIAQANGQLKSKLLFGSAFPAMTPDRWCAEFEKLPIRDEVRPLILKENAARLFGLDGSALARAA